MTEYKLNGAKVLTTDGGRFALPDNLQDMICFVSDGRLYISSSAGMNHHVLGFMERLNRNDVAYRIIYAPLGNIRELYEEATHQFVSGPVESTSDDDSHLQREAVRLIKECVTKGASDIHFRVGANIAEVWVRIHGDLQQLRTSDGIPREYTREHGHNLCSTMYNSMCDVAEGFFQPGRSQDAHIKSEYLKICGLFGARIATRPTGRGYIMELRLLFDYRGRSMTLFDLGYLDEQIKLIRRMTQRTVGVNIFSGPTGSGKSTTLECLLSMLLKEYEYKIHLLTIEDPPEYEIEGSVQTPIICDHSDPVALSREWVSAISNAMRLDPDVMMVGEIRDFDSAVAAFRAAMTGHGLWTTLHANDAISILARLQDIGVQMSLLTDAALVTGLINQSLVPVLCPHCKLPFHEAITKNLLPTDTIERVVQYCDPGKVFVKGPGCKQGGCQEGISGRTVIAEVIGTTQKFMSIFREEGNAASRNYWVNDLGGITKNQHLIRRLNEGIIDPLLAERRVCSLDYDHFTLG